jgi:hypothetical protein
MQTQTQTARRWASTALLAILGAAITAASWIGGEHSLALILGIFYVVCCAATYLWSRGGGDVAAILRLEGDERQRLMDTRATAMAGIATLAFCLAGVVVDLARGGTGNPWALICAVGGVSYTVALAALRVRQ